MGRIDSRWRFRAIAAGLFAVTVAVYSRVAGHELVNYDDLVMVVGNPNLAGPPTPLALLRHFAVPYEGNWLPLYWISLHVDLWLHGPSAPALLFTNVVLHALAAVALFAALERMTGAASRSAFVAAVFALHPLHVESVAWVTERKDVLAGLFWMLGLYAWALYVEEPRSRVRRLAPALCLLLGLLCKATLVTFPFVLLLLDHWPLDRLRGSLRRAVVEKLPLFALAAVASAITYGVQVAAGNTLLGDAYGATARAVNAARSYWAYLADAFWPSGLAVLYPHPFAYAPPTSLDVWLGVLLGLMLVAASALALLAARTHPWLTVGWLWYVGTLVPMIGLVHVGLQARADRYTYIPLVGLAIALAWGIGEAVSKSRPLRRAAAVAACAAIAAIAIVTRLQLAHWQDTVALFGRAAAVTSNNRFAHENLALALSDLGRDREAIAHLQEALRIEPRRRTSIFALAALQRRSGEREAAIESYRRGLELQPNKIRAHGELAVLLVEAGRLDEAEPHLAIALAALPDDAELLAAQAELRARRAAPQPPLRSAPD